MRNKRFDPKLKAAHDAIGKQLAVEIMRDMAGATLIENNDKEDSGDFSAGFWDQKYSLQNGQIIVVEPEMKDSKWWNISASHPDRPFDYSDIDIPYRKAKNKAGLHMVISTCRQYAFLLTRKAMDEHLASCGGEPKIKKTIYEPHGAPYFSTPVSKGFFVAKINDRWQRWRFE